MLGGAPIVIFVTIAQQTNLATAAGAVILTAIAYLIILPVFARCLKYFPKLVIGTILLLVSINLVKIYGGIITGQAGTPSFADPTNILLALATIAITLLFARFSTSMWRQLSVPLGLVARRLSLPRCSGVMNTTGVGTSAPSSSAPVLFSVRLADVRLHCRSSADRVQRHLDGRGDRPDRRDRRRCRQGHRTG